MKFIFLSNEKSKGRSVSLGLFSLVAICFCVVLIVAGLFLSGIQYATKRSIDILSLAREQTTSSWEQELAVQGKVVDKARLNAERSLDAMASRLSLLQGHVMRLDALGSRLASMADLQDLEFGVDSPPGMGGTYSEIEQQSINISGFLQTLDTLESTIQDRSEKLTAIESMLINRTLQEQTFPTGNPAKSGWLSSLYGYRPDPLTGKKQLHNGMDIAGKPGTPITAVASGIVTWSGSRSGGYGKLVEINHGGGYITRYAHNDKNLVSVGEKIEKGEVIAVMGSSGRSTGTHVHFEVLRNGKHMNPKKFFILK